MSISCLIRHLMCRFFIAFTLLFLLACPSGRNDNTQVGDASTSSQSAEAGKPIGHAEEDVQPSEPFVFIEYQQTQEIYREQRQKRQPSLSLEQSCQAGNYSACRDWVKTLQDQLRGYKPAASGQENNPRAIALAKQIIGVQFRYCQQGFRPECQSLFHLLNTYQDELKEMQVAYYEFVQEKCEKGHWQACDLQYFYASSLLRDQQVIEKIVERGCALDHIPHCAKLARRIYSIDKAKFARLLERICKTDVHQCAMVATSQDDFQIKPDDLTKLRKECEKTISVCEHLARYAIRRDDKGLIDWTLDQRCRHDLQRCIEYAIFQAQQKTGGAKQLLKKVCREKQLPDERGRVRRFQNHFEKFTQQFCRGDEVVGSPQDWIYFRL